MKTALAFSGFWFAVLLPLSAFSATGLKTGEQISGLNKICYYNVLGSAYSITIAATQLCPLSIEAPNPAPRPSGVFAPAPPSAGGRMGLLKGEVSEGMNKICYYDVVGSTATLTLSVTSLCPLNHNF